MAPLRCRLRRRLKPFSLSANVSAYSPMDEGRTGERLLLRSRRFASPAAPTGLILKARGCDSYLEIRCVRAHSLTPQASGRLQRGAISTQRLRRSRADPFPVLR